MSAPSLDHPAGLQYYQISIIFVAVVICGFNGLCGVEYMERSG